MVQMRQPQIVGGYSKDTAYVSNRDTFIVDNDVLAVKEKDDTTRRCGSQVTGGDQCHKLDKFQRRYHGQ